MVLQGYLPDWIGDLRKLTNLNASDNKFEGKLQFYCFKIFVPIRCCAFHICILFPGGIPASIGNLRDLKLLNLATNSLTGKWRSWWFVEAHKYVRANRTFLFCLGYWTSGCIPETIGNLVELESLYLFGNVLNGRLISFIYFISPGIHHAQAILSIFFPGSIPDSVGKLVKLKNAAFTRPNDKNDKNKFSGA